MNVKKIVIFLFLSLSFFSCEDAGKNNSITQPVAITFNKVQNDDLFEKITSDKSRLVFNNKIIHDLSTRSNLFDFDFFYNGAGVGIADINNDGLKDVFFCGNQVPNKLYINQGDLTFKDISVS
ncbi:MAG: VCBS repeat-containing protein, partial [Flavobacterium sp.]|nr:VCBS repeat-containing protein [Flavobacterium sp.]